MHLISTIHFSIYCCLASTWSGDGIEEYLQTFYPQVAYCLLRVGVGMYQNAVLQVRTWKEPEEKAYLNFYFILKCWGWIGFIFKYLKWVGFALYNRWTSRTCILDANSPTSFLCVSVLRNVDARSVPEIPWLVNTQKLFQWANEVRVDPNNPEYSDLMEFIMVSYKMVSLLW